MLRWLNFILLGVMLVSAFILISMRYQSRVHYDLLSRLKTEAKLLNQEYSRLQIEEGMYSSNVVLQEVALNKLGLIQPNKQNIVGIK